jgi:hypothetical protein
VNSPHRQVPVASLGECSPGRVNSHPDATLSDPFGSPGLTIANDQTAVDTAPGRLRFGLGSGLEVLP